MRYLFIILSLLQAALFLLLCFSPDDGSLFQPLLSLSLLGVALAGYDAVLLASARMNGEPALGLAVASCAAGLPSLAFVLFILRGVMS